MTAPRRRRQLHGKARRIIAFRLADLRFLPHALAAWAAGMSLSCHGPSDRVTGPEATTEQGLAARPIQPCAAGQLAIDEHSVYFVTEVDPNAVWRDSVSILQASPKSGGPTIELLRSNTQFGPQIQIDDDDVFYARFGEYVPNPKACPPGRLCPEPTVIHGATGEIAAISKHGGPPSSKPTARSLVQGVKSPGALAIDGADVFFFADGALARVPKKGGSIKTLANNVRCLALGVGDSAVYCGSPEGLLAFPKMGGASTLLRGEAVGTAPLVVRDASVLMATSQPGQTAQRILHVSTHDGSASTVASVEWAEFLVVDDRAVYWTREGYLSNVPLPGGDRTVRTPFGTDWPVHGLAVDDARVFWVTRDGHLGSAHK